MGDDSLFSLLGTFLDAHPWYCILTSAKGQYKQLEADMGDPGVGFPFPEDRYLRVY